MIPNYLPTLQWMIARGDYLCAAPWWIVNELLYLPYIYIFNFVTFLCNFFTQVLSFFCILMLRTIIIHIYAQIASKKGTIVSCWKGYDFSLCQFKQQNISTICGWISTKFRKMIDGIKLYKMVYSSKVFILEILHEKVLNNMSTWF